MTKSKKKKQPGLFGEYLYFLKTYKMWWLTPLFILIGLLGIFIVLSGSKALIMIYALF